MSDPDQMAFMTRAELNARAPESLLVLPIGATEQHGPHLAVGTDHLAADHVALEVARRLRGEVPVVVAPVVPYGHSPHHLPFGGTMSVTADTYQRLLVELGTTAVVSGFRRIFLLNGHGGNVEIAAVAAREISRIKDVPVASGSYFIMAWDRLVAAGAADDVRLPGHAGAFETSLMMALHPRAVKEERPVRSGSHGGATSSFFGPYHAAIPGQWEAIDGYSDDPSRADAAAGERYLEQVYEAVADQLRGFYRQT